MAENWGPRMLRGLTSEAALDDFFAAMLAEGYNATTDAPLCFLAEALAKRYPNAKIVLGVRDNKEQYGNSVRRLLKAFRYGNARPWKWVVDHAPYVLVLPSSRQLVPPRTQQRPRLTHHQASRSCLAAKPTCGSTTSRTARRHGSCPGSSASRSSA